MDVRRWRRADDAEDQEDAWDSQWGGGLQFYGAAGAPPDNRPLFRTPHQALEDAVVSIVNQERAKHELGRLRIEERLRTSARLHSRDMAEHEFFNHVTPEGVTPDQRMVAAGYLLPAAENIAIYGLDPLGVMRAWMNSPPHRVNILRPLVRCIGVGIHQDPHEPIAWWTQNFGYL
ncbi:CAP domain-containing protein [Streptomyces sp. NPDC020681]|uniref:CAP domain-containing protein n=1 Tax=Streptomyces sp. NPDC020681 TaxID=3365083 RepID=UPI00379F2161